MIVIINSNSNDKQRNLFFSFFRLRNEEDFLETHNNLQNRGVFIFIKNLIVFYYIYIQKENNFKFKNYLFLHLDLFFPTIRTIRR